MLRFLFKATKIVGLTYQLAASTIMLGALGVGVYQVIQKSRNKKR